MDFFGRVRKISGLVNFQRAQARGLSMQIAFLEPCNVFVILFISVVLFLQSPGMRS